MVIGALVGVVAGILLSDHTLLAGVRKRRSGTRRDVGKARPLRPEGSTAGPSDRSPLDASRQFVRFPVSIRRRAWSPSLGGL